MGERKEPAGSWQYAIRLDCKANGCAEPHRDDGRIFDVGSEPPRLRSVSGHATTLVLRRIGPWKDSADAPLLAECPTCGAMPGQPCRTKNGVPIKRTDSHLPRFRQEATGIADG